MKFPADLCGLTLSDVEGRSDDLRILEYYEAIANTPTGVSEDLSDDLQILLRRELQEFVSTGRSSDVVRAMVCAVLNACTVQHDDTTKRKRASFVLRATGLTAQPRTIGKSEDLQEVEELSIWLDDRHEALRRVAKATINDHDDADGVDIERRLRDASVRRRKSDSE
ncbi:hypothetical protein [Herminiimonas sp. CN]|uniref:hypothetical protein n=1 Tax=Herminiimonas sp. CN TaxID=1349818 RepID=UPI0004735751|nr:hypothetical protein [Herminiimonas sp. CN]